MQDFKAAIELIHREKNHELLQIPLIPAMMNDNGFNFEFEHNGNQYLAYIFHFEDLTAEQREKYKIQENTFLVNLFTPTGFKSFELFMKEDPFIWETNASPIIIDPEIVAIIGNKIDSLSY
ncbi:MAG: hypothetical protein ABUT20_52260 [Bacteroidota bacterium]